MKTICTLVFPLFKYHILIEIVKNAAFVKETRWSVNAIYYEVGGVLELCSILHIF